MEEELELLQAQLIIKQAQLKMVEVNVAAREARFKLMTEAREKHKEAFNEFDILEARYACEMARAELQVRMAEIREIEVKIKYAQKRLENAKAGRLLPMVEPHGRDFSVDEKALAELAERIARLREQIDRNDEAKKKADIALQAAQQELKQAQALPENNPNRTNGIKQAEIKVQDALGDLNRINRERQELILSLQRLQNEYQQLRGK
ncbi:MAG: hypothetical protein RMJ56_13395 [Gemmataceae bacterium]|nr:hypothetical protein [Gemmata sp.]MDW8198587.1 hypothetical protein [Gemmataceae bacterium]